MGYPTDPRFTYLIEPYGTTQGRQIPHTGDDWSRRKVGGRPLQEFPEIYACFSGTVVYSGWHGVAGNRVIIRYWFGLYGDYGHMHQRLVGVNDTVNEGDRIGVLGGTGKVTGPHLHYTQSTNLSVLLKGIYPYWKNSSGQPLYNSVDAWANQSGLRRPNYTTNANGSPQKRGFLMALSDAEQAEVLRRSRENALKLDSLQTWIEAVRGDGLYANGTMSRAQRTQQLVEELAARGGVVVGDSSASAPDPETAKRVGELHDFFLGIPEGGRYSFGLHLRNTMNSIHDNVRGISEKLGIKR